MWMQLLWDMELTRRKAEDEKRPGWLKRGEKAVDARDRLREERRQAKERLGV